MPTNQSPILSHDPDVGPAQPAEHLDSGQFAAAADGSAAVETSDAPATLDARLFEAAIGSLELLSVHLGRRLGLYDAIRDAGEVTVDDLATRAAIAPRYAREWLEQQAVAGFITVDDPDADAAIRRFRLSDEQQAVFVEPEHPAHVSPVADMIAGIGQRARRRRRRLPARHRRRLRGLRPPPAPRAGRHQPAGLHHRARRLARRHRDRPTPAQRGPGRPDRRRRMRAGMVDDRPRRDVPTGRHRRLRRPTPHRSTMPASTPPSPASTSPSRPCRRRRSPITARSTP